jgi:hypothetical protein
VIAFDWYQATVRRPENDVIEALLDLEPGLSVSHSRGAHGYAHAAVVGSEAEGTVARVWHGGSHPFPHVIVSGEWAQPGVELIRARFEMEHVVSRADVRQDFSDEGAFDVIQPHLVDAAARHRVKVGTAGDHLLTKLGRTVYLGAPSSAVRLRLYDKAAELRAHLAKNPAKLAQVPPHLARLEAQVRPATHEARFFFSTMEPVEMLGCARWMREVWNAVAGLQLTPINVGRGWRQSDDERAYRYLLAQYGGVLRRMRVTHGSWECVGLQLGEDLR